MLHLKNCVRMKTAIEKLYFTFNYKQFKRKQDNFMKYFDVELYFYNGLSEIIH